MYTFLVIILVFVVILWTTRERKNKCDELDYSKESNSNSKDFDISEVRNNNNEELGNNSEEHNDIQKVIVPDVEASIDPTSPLDKDLIEKSEIESDVRYKQQLINKCNHRYKILISNKISNNPVWRYHNENIPYGPVEYLSSKVSKQGKIFARFKFSDGQIVIIDTAHLMEIHNSESVIIFKSSILDEDNFLELVDGLFMGINNGELVFGAYNQEQDQYQVELTKKKDIFTNVQANFIKPVENNSEVLFKQDWIKYKQLIIEKNVKSLYHFTDRSNIQSIKRHGALYSWYYCQNNDIDIPMPGGDELSRSLDRRCNLHDFVRVSFTRNHPMMYIAKDHNRIIDPVILEIAPEVIYWKSSKYANKNATRNDAKIGDNFNDFKNIRFDIVKQDKHFDLDDYDKPFYQAEILVLEKIPVEFIRNIDSL